MPPRLAATANQLKGNTSLVNQLRNAVEAASDDDGWAQLANVGHIITKQQPDFDPRSYGYAKLSDLISATTLFEIDRRSPGDGKTRVIYARDKRRRDKKPAPATTNPRATSIENTANVTDQPATATDPGESV
jgi:hypothetical protein